MQFFKQTKKHSVDKNQKHEVRSITILRGIAAMMVLLFHLICVSGDFITNQKLEGVFYYGKYGVQFFFVISGFVIVYSMLHSNYSIKNFFTFFKKRIIRIEPPYLVVLAITVIFFWVRAKYWVTPEQAEYPGWKQILFHIGYLIPFSEYNWLSIVFWTLAIEFQFYLLFSFLIVACLNKWLRWLSTIGLVVGFFFVNNQGIFFYWSPVFLLGVYLALYKKAKLSLSELWIAVFILEAFIFYKLAWSVLIFSIIPFLVIYFEPRIRSRTWEFFGRISYSLYLSHTVIIFSIINFALRYNVKGYQKLVVLAISFTLAIFLSYLLYFFVERPSKAWASRIRYK